MKNGQTGKQQPFGKARKSGKTTGASQPSEITHPAILKKPSLPENVLTAANRIIQIKDKSLRLRSLKEKIKDPFPQMNQLLLELLVDSSEEIRDFLISILGEKEDLELNEIYPKLQESPWYIRSAALRILEKRNDPSALPRIKPLLGDLNADVRKTAAQTLGTLGTPEALALLAKLTQDSNPYVAKAAKEAMEKASQLKFV